MAKNQFPKGSFPGWRTMTAAQRYNARAAAIFDRARNEKTRFNASSRGDVETQAEHAHHARVEGADNA